MTINLQKLSLAVAGAALGLAAFDIDPANAIQFDFYNITGNNAANAQIGEDQLTLDVTDAGSGQALFQFKNIGSNSSAITDIFFEGSDFLDSIASIDNSFAGDGSQDEHRAGVDFKEKRLIGTLSSSNGSFGGFNTTFKVSPTKQPPHKGVNPGDQLGVVFNLASNYSFENLVNAFQSGDVRVGFHVQDYSNEGSEAFVNNPGNNPKAVPEPLTGGLASMVIMGFGGAFKAMSRKKQTQQSA